MINFRLFLYLKVSLVATFSEKRAHTNRKYLTEQGMGQGMGDLNKVWEF